MQVEFTYGKTGETYKFTCEMEQVPRIGEVVYLHPLRYVESVPREIIRVAWFAKEPGDEQVDVKIQVS